MRKRKLIEARKAAGFPTIATGAEACGLHAKYLQGIESGLIKLSDSAAVRIARGYGLTTEAVLSMCGRKIQARRKAS